MHPRASEQFDPRATPYLDTASYGLPPASTIEVLEDALRTWQRGTADWIRDWDPAGDRCRPLAAQLLGSRPEEVALLPAVSVGVGVALSMLSPGDEILIPDDEFASVLLPALVAAERGGLRVRRVPFAALADSIHIDTALVMTSPVRSNDGGVQDLGVLAARAHDVGAKVLVDATHSAGILPIDASDLGLDVVLAAAYKHLLCPRGVALMSVASDLTSSLAPWAASWRSAGEPYDHYYGGDLSVLAATAARFDVSLAWHAWIGAEKSLEFLCSVPMAERTGWCVGLADHLAARLGLTPTGSSILAIPLVRPERARAALKEVGITTSGRGPRIRASFHLYNDMSEANLIAEVIQPFVDSRDSHQLGVRTP